MPSPLAFTDEQIAAIMRAAEPLARTDRAAFLEAVVAALEGRPIGDGQVSGRSKAAISMPRNVACGDGKDGAS